MTNNVGRAKDQGRYTYRHDKVLAVVREVISLSVARANKGLTVAYKPQYNLSGMAVKAKNIPLQNLSQ